MICSSAIRERIGPRGSRRNASLLRRVAAILALALLALGTVAELAHFRAHVPASSVAHDAAPCVESAGGYCAVCVWHGLAAAPAPLPGATLLPSPLLLSPARTPAAVSLPGGRTFARPGRGPPVSA